MIVMFSLLRSKYIKPNDKHTQDALHIFAKNAPAHMHNITMLNSIENQYYQIDAEDHIPKNISSTKIESILKCNQSETGELANTFQIKLNARVMRSSHQRSSIKKGVLRNFTKFTGKHQCQSLFFNKVAGLMTPHRTPSESRYHMLAQLMYRLGLFKLFEKMTS